MAYFEQPYMWWATVSPHLISALIVLIVGWIVALIIASLVKKGLSRTGWGKKIANKMGDDAKNVDPDTWISRIVYYILLVFVVIAVLEVLGLTAIVDPLNQMLTEILAYAPRILGGLIIAVIAWIVAVVARKIVASALKAFKVDESVGSQTGLEQKQVPLSNSVAEAVYWFVWLLFLPMILDALGVGGILAPIQLMLSKILVFLPNLIAALIILVVGWFIAKIIRRIVTNLLVALGSERFSERIGLSKVLGKQGLGGIIGLIVFILVLIPVLIATLQALAIDAVTQPISNMLNQLLNALPLLFGAALVLIIAYVLGKVVGELVANLLEGLGFDRILVHLGLGKEPVEVEGQRSPSEIVGYLAFVVIMLFALIEASQMLNFTLLADIITGFTIFAGRVVLGLIIFAIGIFLANLASRIITTSGMSEAKLLSLAARIAILVFAGAMALLEMGVADQIISLAFGLLLGAIAIAFAVAFGLGGREAAAQEIEKWRRSMKSEKQE
jgi:Mechanosensitive ion channel, conserved TM helix